MLGVPEASIVQEKLGGIRPDGFSGSTNLAGGQFFVRAGLHA
jgi:hypothetical protein